MCKIIIKRGRSQVLYRFTPGAVFRDKESPWYMVSHFNLKPIDAMPYGLMNALENFLSHWQYRGIFPNAIEKADRYLVGEIMEVYYEVFPLVFHCKKCNKLHWYQNISTMKEKNPEGRCEQGCGGERMLIQYPYAYVHENGSIEPLIAPRGPENNYRNIVMVDKGQFRHSYWRYVPTGKTVSVRASDTGLGSRVTTGAGVPGVTNMMHGVRLNSGDVFYSHSFSIVDINKGVIEGRNELSKFGTLQLGAYLEVNSFEPKKYKSLFEKGVNENTSTQNELLDIINQFISNPNAGVMPDLENIKARYEQLKSSAAPIGEKVINEVNQLIHSDIEMIARNDMSLHEYLYCRYEISCSYTLNELIEDAIKQTDVISEAQLKEAEKVANKMGIKNLMLHEEFPVMLAAVGYTRAKYKPEEAVIMPFQSNPNDTKKAKLPIPIIKSKNEALMFSLNPRRVAAWLIVNNLLAKPINYPFDSDAEAAAWIYSNLNLALYDSYKLSEAELTKDSGDFNEAATILTFRLLHTITHLIIHGGKKYIGLDTDSLSEYLFPSTLSSVIYVAKHHAFSLGALITTFKHELSKWLSVTKDHSISCVFDPTCRETSGACHACTFLKFSCKYFNKGLNRNLLIGGKVKELDKRLIGYWSSIVTNAM